MTSSETGQGGHPTPPAPVAGVTTTVQDNSASGLESSGGPTCSRQRWFAWRQHHHRHNVDNPDQQHQPDHQHRHVWHHIRHWHHHSGPDEVPPRDWQQWQEQRWHGRCPFSGRIYHPKSAKERLSSFDDSRWMEDFFDWY